MNRYIGRPRPINPQMIEASASDCYAFGFIVRDYNRPTRFAIASFSQRDGESQALELAEFVALNIVAAHIGPPAIFAESVITFDNRSPYVLKRQIERFYRDALERGLAVIAPPTEGSLERAVAPRYLQPMA